MSIRIGFVLALLFVAGCKSTGDQLRDDAATWIKTAQAAGVTAEADVYLSPDGGFWFGPALGVQNRSYVIMHLRADTAKGKLLTDSP